MSEPPHAAITSFRRRVRWAAFVAGSLQAMLVVGVGWAVTLIVLRVCGIHLAVSWWWLGLAVPVLTFGVMRARRDAMGHAVAAAHLDRRLGLDGLLLCAGEGQQLAPEWQARVERRLVALPAALPQLRWRKLLPLPALGIGLAALTAMLPPPAAAEVLRPRPMFQAEVGRLGAELRELFERGHVPEEVEAELERKLAELKHEVEAGEVPEWRELDDLDQRISREQLIQLAGEAKDRGASAAAARESKGRSMQSLALAAKALAQLGLLDKLEPHLAAALQAVRNPDGTFALDKLPFDAAELQRLAAAFGDAFGDLQLGDLDLSALGLEAGALGDLQALLEGLGNGSMPGPGQGEGAGRGGVDRGPGHAALSFTESAPGSAAKTMPLPPGRGLPKDWVPVGSERIEPVVAPVTNQGAGAAGATGSGGATWQLEYAPRHRAVLKRFFGEEGK